ncbi:hypothetical protein PHYC_03135 [Phycisphaerales bacterium]|nr:hypothetical protein PHYC_03135 [Phycisphaerales bacterium]
MRTMMALCAGAVCLLALTLRGASPAPEVSSTAFRTPGGGTLLLDGRAVRVEVSVIRDFMPPILGEPPTAIFVTFSTRDSRGLPRGLAIRDAQLLFGRAVWNPRFMDDIRTAGFPNPNQRTFLARGGPAWPVGARTALKLTLNDGRTTRRIDMPVRLGRTD